MKKLTWIYVTAFFILCMIPSVGMLFYKTELAENRSLSEKPQIYTETGVLNAQYFDELQTYISEHFAFRGELVEADSRIKYELFHTPCDDQVVIGKAGWLFFGETLADYAGVTLTETELDNIAEKLAKVCDYVRSQGKEPLFVIVPNKNSIYGEYMPARFGSCAQVRNLTLLQERMDERQVPYVDAYRILLDNKEKDELYLHEDTHWNNTGARLVLNEIYAAYGISEAYDLSNYTIEESHEPDLYKILFPAAQHYEEQRVYEDGRSYEYIGRLHSLDDITIRTSSGAGSGKSILVYRDSFGRAMIPYMGAAFDNAVFHRSTPYNLSLAGQTECDYVLFEIVERNLCDFGQIEVP
ncbi:MAG: hypothetical protein K2N73_11440 [Lachnospiraceae bacterium]|nr:hypothetical protein [Lachnospiraceae bacterium]